MHKLLARQLQRHLHGAPPPELEAFLRAVDEAYRSSDEDRLLLERSLDLSSHEMLALNARLQVEIAGERSARADLSQDRHDLEEIIRRIPFPTAIRQGRRYAFVNPAWAALLGREPEELLGRDILEHIVPEDQPAVLASMERADGPRSPARASPTLTLKPVGSRWLRKDDAVVEVEVFPVWRITFRGESAVLLAAADETERKRLQAQMVASDRMVSIGTLAAGVAHEINNPLAYVLCNLDYLASDLPALLPPGDHGELLEALRDAREGLQRVRQIVKDLKTFSRSDEQVHARVDLHAVLESAANMARNEVRHRAKLVKDLQPTPPVAGNEGKLGQVFLNLLVNAAQAMPDGAADRNEIRLSCRTGPDGVAVVEVSDTGSGIPDELLRRIFDPFFTTKPVGVGTGLGLSICQGIVHAHGGKLEVSSEVGRGSTFRVTLPPAAADVPDVAAAAGAIPATPSRRVLVVDDEVNVGAAIRRALSAHHEVVATTSAREALASLLRGEVFDLVLCDVMMPEMTGEELYRELQRLKPEMAAKMVFMSGGAFSPSARQFLDRMANRHLDKPIDLARLRTLVAEAA
ncbi:MAG TPA: ATP-binding protein [Myxococcales bacterium]|nr:ATP-binding protein [Myxococcales bacterium]